MDENSLDPTGFPVERPVPPDHRSGFVALVGRANVGKSTLLNQLVGRKVAIVSAVPQTTRTRVLGVRTTPNSQIAFIEESRILSDDEPLQHYLEQILPQKVKLDLLYVERRSVWFNVRILFWGTIAVITRRNIAVHRASGRMNLRRR